MRRQIRQFVLRIYSASWASSALNAIRRHPFLPIPRVMDFIADAAGPHIFMESAKESKEGQDGEVFVTINYRKRHTPVMLLGIRQSCVEFSHVFPIESGYRCASVAMSSISTGSSQIISTLTHRRDPVIRSLALCADASTFKRPTTDSSYTPWNKTGTGNLSSSRSTSHSEPSTRQPSKIMFPSTFPREDVWGPFIMVSFFDGRGEIWMRNV